MVSGYVSQVKTMTSTGDLKLAVEVVKEQIAYAFPLNLEKVVIMTEGEYAKMAEVVAMYDEDLKH